MPPLTGSTLTIKYDQIWLLLVSWGLSGGCLVRVWKVSGACLEGVWGFEEGVCGVSGRWEKVFKKLRKRSKKGWMKVEKKLRKSWEKGWMKVEKKLRKSCQSCQFFKSLPISPILSFIPILPILQILVNPSNLWQSLPIFANPCESYFFTQPQFEARQFYTSFKPWKCVKAWQKLPHNKTAKTNIWELKFTYLFMCEIYTLCVKLYTVCKIIHSV